MAAPDDVGQQAVRLHGGIGGTDGYIVINHCFKQLTRLDTNFGATSHHLGGVSSRMQDTTGVFA